MLPPLLVILHDGSTSLAGQNRSRITGRRRERTYKVWGQVSPCSNRRARTVRAFATRTSSHEHVTAHNVNFLYRHAHFDLKTDQFATSVFLMCAVE
jgi:hypothetical protein